MAAALEDHNICLRGQKNTYFVQNQLGYLNSGNNIPIAVYSFSSANGSNSYTTSNMVRHGHDSNGGYELGCGPALRPTDASPIDPLQPGDGFIAPKVNSPLRDAMFGVSESKQMEKNLSNGSFPAGGIQSYTPSAGETFQSIAAKLGNPDMGAAIAGYNNFSPNSQPTAEMPLKIPPEIPIRNNAKTTVPYQLFTNILVAGMYPILQTPQPHPHENFLGVALELLAAAAVTIAVPELAAEMGILTASSGLTTVALVDATAGILSNAAMQGVGTAFDLQHGFSVKNMLLAGGEAAISAISFGNATHLSLAKSLVISAGNAIDDELLEMVANPQEKFDFTRVLANVVNQFVASQVDGFISDKNPDNTLSNGYCFRINDFIQIKTITID